MRTSSRVKLRRRDRAGFSRTMLVLGVAAGLTALAWLGHHRSPRPGRGEADPRLVPVTITWAMAERFGPGYDRNGDGRPDLPNSFEYANPGRYEVKLAAHADTVGPAIEAGACNWTVVGRAELIKLPATGPRPTVRLPEGTYTVTVTVKLADGRIGSARETIRVRDILIVALGDSLATGEGNPERPARWEANGTANGLAHPGTPRSNRSSPLGQRRSGRRATPHELQGCPAPGRSLARSGPSLDLVGSGPVRHAVGGCGSPYLGHLHLPGRDGHSH